MGVAIFTAPAPASPGDRPGNTLEDIHTSEALIINNGGGVVDDFLDLRDKFNRDGTKVIIKGNCMSSCTLFTAVENVCFDKNATLGFHAPYIGIVVSTGSRFIIWSDSYTEFMLSQYPQPIRDWIVANGGLGHDFILLEGEELAKLVPICPTEEPAIS